MWDGTGTITFSVDLVLANSTHQVQYLFAALYDLPCSHSRALGKGLHAPGLALLLFPARLLFLGSTGRITTGDPAGEVPVPSPVLLGLHKARGQQHNVQHGAKDGLLAGVRIKG